LVANFFLDARRAKPDLGEPIFIWGLVTDGGGGGETLFDRELGGNGGGGGIIVDLGGRAQGRGWGIIIDSSGVSGILGFLGGSCGGITVDSGGDTSGVMGN
jgi:hypothetical protein